MDAPESRYVIHCHHTGPNSPPDDPNPHFDLMWEEQAGAEQLRTIQLATAPTAEALATGIAYRDLQPHRRAYLETDRAEVSGDRGRVERWDSGSLQVIGEDDNDPSTGLLLRLAGHRVKATIRLRAGVASLA